MYTSETDRTPPFNSRQLRFIEDADSGVVTRVERKFDYAVSGLGKRTKQQIVPELLIKWMERMHDRLEATAETLGEQDAVIVRLMLTLYRDEIAEMKAARDEAISKVEERKRLYRRVPLSTGVGVE